MPEWLETSRTSRMGIIGVVQVPDAAGKTRHLVVEMTGFVTMGMEGALLKLTPLSRDLVARPGQPISVHLRLTRSPKLPDPANVQCKLPEDLATHVSAQPAGVPPGQEEVDYRSVPSTDARLAGLQTITLRATVLQDGRWPAVSETRVPVEFSAGAAAPRN